MRQTTSPAAARGRWVRGDRAGVPEDAHRGVLVLSQVYRACENCASRRNAVVTRQLRRPAAVRRDTGPSIGRRRPRS